MDLEKFEPSLKRLHDEIQELWIEKQLLRKLIIDSQWMPEDELDANLEKAKKHPANVRLANANLGLSEQTLAEPGLHGWLADLEARYPRND